MGKAQRGHPKLFLSNAMFRCGAGADDGDLQKPECRPRHLQHFVRQRGHVAGDEVASLVALSAQGVQAVLVGETLMRAGNPADALRYE